MSDPYNEQIKICGFCKKEIEKGTGFWLKPNPLRIKYAHQSCYHEMYNRGKSILGGNKK